MQEGRPNTTDVFMEKGGWTQTGTQGGHCGDEGRDWPCKPRLSKADQQSLSPGERQGANTPSLQATSLPVLDLRIAPFRRETPEIPMVYMAQ